MCRLSARKITPVDVVDYSHRIFPSPRRVRFLEMEYSLPAEAYRSAMADIRAAIDRHRFAVNFPLECRFVKGDDIWLSPAYERDAAYIAVHMFKGMPYKTFFDHMEAIFLAHEGRPHWGKMHTLGPAQLAERYLKWPDFRRLRAEVDPQGLFLNDYLRRLFGVAE